MQHCNDLCYINGKKIVKFKSNQKNHVELDNFRWIGDIFLHNTFFQYQIIHVQHFTIVELIITRHVDLFKIYLIILIILC